MRWFLQETRGAHKHGHKKRCGLAPVCMVGGRLRCMREKLLGARGSLFELCASVRGMYMECVCACMRERCK